MTAKPYNGHPSWNAWNVALWIGNDEPMYRMALDCITRSKVDRLGKPRPAKRQIRYAAALFCAALGHCGTAKTPDGARYSLRSVALALQGLES